MKSRFITLFAILAAMSIAGPVGASWYRDSQSIMGTRIEVELWSENSELAGKLLAAVMQEMHRIDSRMSTYKPDSELSRINAKAGRQWVFPDSELFELINFSLSMSELTGGSFDITYASLGRYYDFRKKFRPASEKIDSLLDRIDYRSIRVDPAKKSLRFTSDETYVDLGGIAKGYAVDRGIKLLREAGIRHAIVTAGGDSRILGDRRGRPWLMGIRHPRSDKEVIARMPVVDEAVSTSGDYERFFEQDGVRYHHIINPRTGDSAREVSSVTVIGKEAVQTDALSTALFVMGVHKALKLINSMKDYEAVIVNSSGEMFYSSGFSRKEQ